MKYIKTFFFICHFLILPLFLSAQVQAPAGWRYPDDKDIIGDWKEYKSPFHFTSDFNGDGVRDHAWILIRKNNSGWGLFVFLGAKQGASSIIKLMEDVGPAQRYAISLTAPSKEKWKTACGKGYFECKPGEPEEIQIKAPSIELCYIESSCSIYMWNRKTNKFSAYQMSD